MKEHLIEIYKVEAEKYNSTRDIHWKMNTAIWTALVIAVYAKYHSEISIDILPVWSKLLIALIIVTVHIIFIYEIHQSMARSLARMNEMATYLIEDTTNSPLKWAEVGTQTKLKNNNWKFFQILITLLLLAILLLTRKGSLLTNSNIASTKILPMFAK